MIIKNAIIMMQPGTIVDVDGERDVFDDNTIWTADVVPGDVLSFLPARGLSEGDATVPDNAAGIDGDQPAG